MRLYLIKWTCQWYCAVWSAEGEPSLSRCFQCKADVSPTFEHKKPFNYGRHAVVLPDRLNAKVNKVMRAFRCKTCHPLASHLPIVIFDLQVLNMSDLKSECFTLSHSFWVPCLNRSTFRDCKWFCETVLSARHSALMCKQQIINYQAKVGSRQLANLCVAMSNAAAFVWLLPFTTNNFGRVYFFCLSG